MPVANFDYCPLVWMFLSASSLKKIQNLQKRALRFLYNDYEISYEELFLKSDRAIVNVNRLRILCIEIYKTINNLNPEFIDIFLFWRYTNADLKISLYVCVQIKIVPWKFRILNYKNSRVIFPWSLWIS